MRRILFVGTLFGTLAACGSIVGVTDLRVVGIESEPEDAGEDVVIEIPDTSKFEVDDGIKVEPPIDSGCPPTLFGTFKPTIFEGGGQNGGRMNWLNQSGVSRPEEVQTEDGKDYVCQAYVFAGSEKTSTLVKFSGFKTFVPDNKKIVGIAVDLRARGSRPAFFVDSNLRLAANENDTTSSANHADPRTWPSEYEKRTYGGPGTLWELEKSLEPSLVNQPDFGVVFAIAKVNGDPTGDYHLDSVSLSVYVCP